MEVRRLGTQDDTPINRAVMGIQHYISTGDYVGEAIVFEARGGEYLIGVPHDPRNPEDLGDWLALRARLDELRDHVRFSVEHFGREGRFEHWIVRIHGRDLDRFAGLLREQPGPRGWGSPYETLRAHGLAGP